MIGSCHLLHVVGNTSQKWEKPCKVYLLTVLHNINSPYFLTLSKLKYPAWHATPTSVDSENSFPVSRPFSASESLWNCDTTCSSVKPCEGWGRVRNYPQSLRLHKSCGEQQYSQIMPVAQSLSDWPYLICFPLWISSVAWTKLSWRQNVESLRWSEAT